MEQNALSVVTYIKSGSKADLESLLEVIGQDVHGQAGNTYVSFDSLKTIHFACWVVLPAVADSSNPSNVYRDTLVLETNYDGTLDAHLDELVTRGGKGLDAVYTHCEGWPATGSADKAACIAFLKAHMVATPAFYVGCPRHTVDDVRNARDVRMAIETFLDSEDKQGKLQGSSSADIVRRIKEHLATGSIKPVKSIESLDAQISRSWRNVFIAILIGLPLLLLFSPLILIWYVVLRINEIRDAKLVQAPLPVDPRLFGKEDIWVQNHLTTLVDVKPGKFRLGTLKFVLWLVNILAKTVFITGQLGGIPTIHFARWLFLENDRRLLFFSNYDGSWASYLGDFVDKANYGLTAVWSNTDRFPPSKNLAFGGAQHIEAFKAWSRQHNVYAAVWYSAYPHETVQNLKTDLRIRDAVAADTLSEADIQSLLQRL